MKVQFNIHFKTQWGQFLVLVLQNCDGTSENITLHCNDKFIWEKEISVDQNTSTLTYQYGIQTPDKSLIYEFGQNRIVHIDTLKDRIIIFDTWRVSYGESPFISAAFSDCFFKRKEPLSIDSSGNLLLSINCPQIESDRHLAIVGNQHTLGNWDVSKKIRLDETNYPVWSIKIDTSSLQFPVEYKYLLVDSTTDEVLSWEEGSNRRISFIDSEVFTIRNDEHFTRTIPAWKGAGVAIPVFSLRSEEGFGIGEFKDLKRMVDWAKRTGQHIIQTLPINDTILYHTNYDSYPYNAVSVYALHPIYLHLEDVGTLKTKKQKDYFTAKKQELNAKTFADYQHVMNAKWEYFKAVYPHESKKIFATDDYKSFFEANKEWLVPYAAFSYLRDLNGTPEFAKWLQFTKYDKAEVDDLSSPDKPHYHDIAIFYFLQYHLHKQLIGVHDYARENGIAIKGDIPIGVSPKSVDTWVDPELFNSNVQAGAPPDDFSATGQNWGFPTYNWELMEEDGYQWWRKRFQKLAEYFDAYRIDHILGFFRIWEIPVDAVWGLTGSFHPALPFTVTELESKGLHWNENRYLKPYIKPHVISDIFGHYSNEVIDSYLIRDGVQNYIFKSEFDTQKKIEAYFASFDKLDTRDNLIRDGLYMLHCEVLFVRDSREQDKYHPRIALLNSATYRDLPIDTKQLLESIYIDYFYHRHTEFWKQQALKKLPVIISSTQMLVCGEDLGMMPDSVPEVMNQLEIISLEIQRMSKIPNLEFGIPCNAPYLSVCTTGTHDMNPLRTWWVEDAAVSQRFYNQVLGMQGPAPVECQTWIVERIIQQHLDAKAMLVILPWQDWVAIDEGLRYQHPLAERINVPSNPRNFWCYRMHITLEQLLTEERFNNKIKEMIRNSGR